MWFYDVESKDAIETVAKAKTKKTTKPPLKTTNVVIGVIFVIAMIGLAIIANITGWSTGADKILTAILGLVGGIPIGVLFGESGAVKS